VGGRSDGGRQCRACSPVCSSLRGFDRPGRCSFCQRRPNPDRLASAPCSVFSCRRHSFHSRQICVRTRGARRPAFCLHSVRLRQHSFLREFRPAHGLVREWIRGGGLTLRARRRPPVEARQRGSPHCAGPVTNSGPTASTTPGTTVTTDLLTPPAASRRVTAIEVQCHQGRRRRAGQVHHAQVGSCSGGDTRADPARLPDRSGSDCRPPRGEGLSGPVRLPPGRPPVSA
jgi:hypothetical protein